MKCFSAGSSFPGVRRAASSELGISRKQLRRNKGRAVLAPVEWCVLWFKIRKRSLRLNDENCEAGTLGGQARHFFWMILGCRELAPQGTPIAQVFLVIWVKQSTA